MDRLPVSPKWVSDVIKMKGNKLDANHVAMTEEVELWRQDPVDCIKELIRSPTFAESLVYEPVQVFRGQSREYSEMNTADWWWTIQVCVNWGRMFNGLISTPGSTA